MGNDEKADPWLIEDEVVIDHPTGLHARPAIAFTKCAKTFAAADIQIRGGHDGPWIDAKSIVKVMGLKLKSGAVLSLRARGDQAGDAVTALKSLVQRKFDEPVDS